MIETNAVGVFLFGLGCNQGFFTGDALEEHASLPLYSTPHPAYSLVTHPSLLCPVTSLFSVAWSHPQLTIQRRAGYHPPDLAFLTDYLD